MEKTTRRGLCVWLVAPSTGGIKRLRIGGSLILALSITVGSVTGLLGCVVLDYVQVLWKQASSNYAYSKVMQERDFLMQEKTDLQSALETAKSQASSAIAFHQDLKKKMDELFSIVEASTGLGFAQPGNPTTRTGKSTRSVAALARRSDTPTEKLRKINRGLGGAEIECRRDMRGKVSCSSSARKENISYEEVQASLKPAVLTAEKESSVGTNAEIANHMDHYIKVIRALPIGWPVSGDVTSGFGYRTSPFTGRGSIHEGMDVAAAPGTRVRVTGDGTVDRVERDGAYGLVIDVVHLDGIVTRYAHLSTSLVRPGAVVTRGQVLALTGSSGRSTGPHLHYEVRVNGRARNPNSFVALAAKLRRFAV